jgi:DNA-directed RNA polymerase subunit RPC12/RpoP
MKDFKAYKMPKNKCLDCGKAMDGATSVEHTEKPHEGSVSICFYCGHIMIFDEKLKFRELTDSEIIELAAHPTILRIQKARGQVLEKYRVKNKTQE